MKNTFQIFLLILSLGFSGCRGTIHEKNKFPKSVNYTVVSRTTLFNKKNTLLSIDTVNNVLIVKLTLNEMENLPYPVDQKDKDTLFNTAFNFDFYCNNKIILSDYNKNEETKELSNYLTKIRDGLQFVSDTIYLKQKNELIYEIPFYAFHNLKKGIQSLELHVWQNTFKGFSQDSISKFNKKRHINYATKCLLDAKVKFDIVIPPIYESTVYGFGLQLKNDSTFSPAGMDNTIWNSSYPDIYWTLYYPTDKFYAQTDYQKSTDKYTDLDTFELYHYYLNDSIGIGVFDHDDLSRDDGMGYWVGPLEYLKREPRRRFGFGNIEWFDIKTSKTKLVN